MTNTERLVTQRFSVLITGTILSDELTADTLGAEFAGTSHCGSDGVLIPGVVVWENVTVTRTGNDPKDVAIAATVLAHERVQGGGEYAGEAVTVQFIADYVTNTGDFFFGHGDEFSPDGIQVLQAM